MRHYMVLIAVLFVAMSSVSYAGESPSNDVQKNFSVASGGKLTVTVNGGDISLKVWDKMQVQMIARNIGDQADRLHTEQNGNNVTVEFRSHWGWTGSDKDLRFEFYVPKDFNVELSTSGGDIGISGGLNGNATLHTSGGDLTLDGLGGRVDGKTSGGDITAHDIEGVANLSTSGGDIEVGHSAKDLEISTSGGDISVGSVDGNLRASTSGGDMQIKKVGGNLTATTSSGDVTVGNVGGSVTLSTSGGDISLGSGNGQINASTSGGDVNIKGAVGSANVSTSGGTVKVELNPTGDRKSRITSSGGDVYLYLPDNAKATITADISGGDDDKIISDFPVTLEPSRDSGDKHIECKLNGGGQEIYLYTTSGSIYIKRQSAK